MDLYSNNFMDELLSQNQFSSNGFTFEYFDQNSRFIPNSSSNQELYTFNEINNSLHYEFSTPKIIDSSHNTIDTPFNTPSFLAQKDYPLLIIENEDPCFRSLETTCKMEPNLSFDEMPFNTTSSCLESKSLEKKMQGKPSKNLMAERRRRKKLNDRLSMLRSIVPKISKTDRTSIIGDTIDYMKELLDKINNLKQQEIEIDSNMVGIFNDVKPDEILIKNSSKFKVEKLDVNTKVEISCAGKQGLLLSTVNTLESLDLEIQQCVISCFNDFSMQASCSESKVKELGQRTISSEDIKLALFRSAGYGGQCL